MVLIFVNLYILMNIHKKLMNLMIERGVENVDDHDRMMSTGMPSILSGIGTDLCCHIFSA